MLQAFLDWQRATLLYKCAGLTGEQLVLRPVPPSGLSLLGLVRHMTKVERIWFRMRFAGEQVDFPFGSDFQAEFEQADPARAAADYARLTEEIKHADAAAANASRMSQRRRCFSTRHSPPGRCPVGSNPGAAWKSSAPR